MSKNLIIKNKLTIIDQLSISKYLNELASDKDTLSMTPDLEHSLFLEYKLNKNEQIKERILKANLRWVVTIAKQYTHPKALLPDLINEGNIGLMKAFDKYDTTFGNTFLTFATWYIRQEINMYLTDTLDDIVQPANRYRISKKIKKAEAILRDRGYDHPSIDQVIELYMQIKEKTEPVLSAADYVEIMVQGKGFVSMETPVAGAEDEMTLSTKLMSSDDYNADYMVVKTDKTYEINEMLSECLTIRERDIVEYTYGLNGKEEKTLDQIAEIIGLTRERVGQLLQGALGKLKEHKKKMLELCVNDLVPIQLTEQFYHKG